MIKKYLDSEGLLQLMKNIISLDSEGDGIAIDVVDHHKVIKVKRDDKTIVLDSEGNLETRLGGWVEPEEIISSLRFADGYGMGAVATSEGTKWSWDVDVEYIQSLIDDEINFTCSGWVKVDGVNETLDFNGVFVKQSDELWTYEKDADHKFTLQIQMSTLTGMVTLYSTGNMTDASVSYFANEVSPETIHYADNNLIKVDGITIFVNSEGALEGAAQTEIDEKTVIKDSEGKLSTAIGGWVEHVEATEGDNIVTNPGIAEGGSNEAYWTANSHVYEIQESASETFTAHCSGVLKRTDEGLFELPFDQDFTFHRIDVQSYDKAWESDTIGDTNYCITIEVTEDNVDDCYVNLCVATMQPVPTSLDLSTSVMNEVLINPQEEYWEYHKVDNKFINIDEDTIILNSEGQLVAANANIDNKTIIINSEGEIETQLGGYRISGYKPVEALLVDGNSSKQIGYQGNSYVYWDFSPEITSLTSADTFTVLIKGTFCGQQFNDYYTYTHEDFGGYWGWTCDIEIRSTTCKSIFWDGYSGTSMSGFEIYDESGTRDFSATSTAIESVSYSGLEPYESISYADAELINFDRKTIIVDSEGIIQTAIGGWYGEGDGVDLLDVGGLPYGGWEDYDVYWRASNELENYKDKDVLYVHIKADIDTNVYDEVVKFYHRYSDNYLTSDSFAIGEMDNLEWYIMYYDPDNPEEWCIELYDANETADLNSAWLDNAYVYEGTYHKIDSNFINVDGTTIFVNSEGELESLPQVDVDEETIVKNSEGKLQTVLGGWRETGADITVCQGVASVQQATETAHIATVLVSTLAEGATSITMHVNAKIYFADSVTNTINSDLVFNYGSHQWEASYTFDASHRVTITVLENSQVIGHVGSALINIAGSSVPFAVSTGIYNALEITCKSTDVTIHYADSTLINFDGETIVVDDDNVISVPIDGETIIVNSEGWLEVNLDSMSVDEKTIILNSEGIIETAFGGYIEPEISLHDILLQSSEGTSGTSIGTNAYQVSLDYNKAVKAKNLDSIELDASIWLTLSPIGSTIYYHPGFELKKVKKNTWYTRYRESSASLAYTDAFFILDTDAETAVLNIYHNSGSGMSVSAAVFNNVEFNIDHSEMIHYGDSNLIHFDKETITVDSEGVISIPIDNLTIIVNSEGELTAVPEPLMNGIATEVKYIGSAETVNVLFDNETIVLNSEGKLSAAFEDVEIDEKTIILDSEGKLQTAVGGWIEAGGPPTISGSGPAEEEQITSESSSYVWYTTDIAQLVIDNPNEMHLEISGDITESLDIEWNDEYEAWVYTDSDKAIGMATGTGVAGKYALMVTYFDRSFTSTPNINYEFSWEGESEDIIHYIDNKFINIDNETIILNSEGELAGAIDKESLLINSEGLIEVRALTKEEILAILV